MTEATKNSPMNLLDQVKHYSPKTEEAYIPKNKIVQIKIRYGEVELARQVKSLGGKWNREKKVWDLSYGNVQTLGLIK